MVTPAPSLRSQTRWKKMVFCKDLRIYAVAVFLVVAQVSGASTSTEENCTVTVGGPDSFTYKLSHPHLPKGVCPDWETKDEINLAWRSQIDEKLVEKLTNVSITMKKCTEYLRAKWMNSEIREETICRVNCSALLEQQHPQPVVTCLFKDFCGWKAALCISVLAIVSIAVVLVALICVYRKRRAAQRASYTPANKMEMATMQNDQQN